VFFTATKSVAKIWFVRADQLALDSEQSDVEELAEAAALTGHEPLVRMAKKHV